MYLYILPYQIMSSGSIISVLSFRLVRTILGLQCGVLDLSQLLYARHDHLHLQRLSVFESFWSIDKCCSLRTLFDLFDIPIKFMHMILLDFFFDSIQ